MCLHFEIDRVKVAVHELVVVNAKMQIHASSSVRPDKLTEDSR